ncbi:hypothetical protein ACWCQK_41250 [Streptomyces sp. NPDC002306]
MADDSNRRRLTRPLTVKNDTNLIGVLFKWIRTLADGTPVTWAIEDGGGFARRLADGLLLAGHEVVWVLTRLMSAHRNCTPPPAPSPTPSTLPRSPTPQSPPRPGSQRAQEGPRAGRGT